MNAKQIILIVIAVLALIFIIQNTATVTVAFLFFEIALKQPFLRDFNWNYYRDFTAVQDWETK